ncbi:MAG TPA: RNA polymerase subunit sigma-24, partial [Ruminococcaceae bacterium]|nr:RNA polymerase subunit sigma-24 [Oscillospiraceae bacterium]
MLSFYLLMIDTDKDKIKFEKLYIQYRRLMHYIADN